MKNRLQQLRDYYQADEIIIAPNVYSIEKRKQNIQLLAEITELE